MSDNAPSDEKDFSKARQKLEDAGYKDILDHQGNLTQEITDEIRLKSMRIGSKLGKPRYANGRRAVIELIDAMLQRPQTMAKIAEQLRERLDVDAIGFIKEIAMPLMPKSMIEDRDDLDTSKDGQGTVVVLPDNGRPLTLPDTTPDRDQPSRPDQDHA